MNRDATERLPPPPHFSLQDSTLHTQFAHLSKLAIFANSKYCPGTTKTHNDTHMERLASWYSNSIGKLRSQDTQERHKSNPVDSHGLTITTIWDCLRAEWKAFKDEVSDSQQT